MYGFSLAKDFRIENPISLVLRSLSSSFTKTPALSFDSPSSRLQRARFRSNHGEPCSPLLADLYVAIIVLCDLAFGWISKLGFEFLLDFFSVFFYFSLWFFNLYFDMF